MDIFEYNIENWKKINHEDSIPIFLVNNSDLKKSLKTPFTTLKLLLKKEYGINVLKKNLFIVKCSHNQIIKFFSTPGIFLTINNKSITIKI